MKHKIEDFIYWMESEYGTAVLFIFQGCVGFCSLAFITLLLIATNGWALAAVPAWAAWMVYLYTKWERDQ